LVLLSAADLLDEFIGAAVIQQALAAEQDARV